MAKYRKLSRTADQRKALLRNQVTNLLYHGKIVTTEAKAKEIRKIAESLIAMAVREKDNFETVTVTAKVARKDADGKYLTRKKDGKDVKIQFTDVTIYWFSDEAGIPVKGNNYITRRADNLFQNSTRIVTVAEYKKQQAAAKAAKEAAQQAKDALVDDAEGGDDDLM